MKRNIRMHDQDLEALFAEARAQVQPDTAQLQARVLRDADIHLPQMPGPAYRFPRKTGFLEGLAKALGGRGVLAGLAGAALAGVMVGFVQPTPIATIAATFFADGPLEELELIPTIDANFIEG